MLLSEAILLGSMATKKAVFQQVAADGSRCALGAAFFAVGKQREVNPKTMWGSDVWSYAGRPVTHPVLGEEFSLEWCIASLNNGAEPYTFAGHNASEGMHFPSWTREAIAAWVAEKERELGITDETETSATTSLNQTPATDVVTV